MTKSQLRNLVKTGSTWATLIAVAGMWLAGELRAADKPAAKGAAASKTKSKTGDSPSDADDSVADYSQDVDEDATALVVPSELLGKADKASRLKFSSALRGLLQEGIAPEGAAAAKRHYETAHQAVAGDPRAAYAYGLAFLEQKNTKEALAQFRAAAKHTTGTYLPALQAIAWVQIQRNEWGPGLTALSDLARRVEESKSAWPNERDRQLAAEWLGRVMGFLTGRGKSADHATQIDETAGSIEKLLTVDRQQAYQRGRKSIGPRQKELEALAARPVAEVVSEMNAKRQQARTDAHAAEAEIKRIEDEIRDAKKPFEQQIAEANLEIRTNGQKVKSASKDIPDAEENVAELSVPRTMPNGVRSYRGVPYAQRVRAENTQERKSRESQLSTAQQRLQQLRTSVENAKQSMAEARKQRDKAHADLRSAIAAKQPELREARRKSQEAAAKLKDIEHAALSPEQIKSRVTALDAYVPLDPLVEKNRLLATLKVAD